jgi:hypothetical protein
MQKIISNTRQQWVPARSWFLFNTWFSLLAICVSAAATLRVPISSAAWPVFICCTGLVIILAIRSRRAERTRIFPWRLILTSVLISGAVVVVLWGSLIKGEFVSVYPDPWAYSAFGVYVRAPVPVISDGSQPVLSFGAFLTGTRYATAGLLALFAEVSRTDTCRSAAIFAFVVLLQIGFGFALLARIFGAGPVLSLSAGLFGVTLGWAPEILKIGNWDQVLFVSFIPFALLRFRFSAFQTSRSHGILGLGLCLGAATFAYPEGAAMSGVIYLPLLFWKLLRGKDTLRKIRRLAVATGVALLVSSVYLPTFASFLYMQILRGETLVPGSGTFSGLLSARWLPAVYGLGEQAPVPSLDTTELIVPLLFIGLSFLALITWWRKKDGILLTVPVFFLLTLWQGVLLRYDYGFYKVLTMFWPMMVVAIFVGMSRLLAWSPPGWSRSVLAVALCGLIGGALSDEFAQFQYAPWRKERRIKPFLELTRLRDISKNALISLRTEDWFNQQWAIFFLQGYRVVVPNPLAHLANSATGLKNATSDQPKGAFVLTDKPKAGAAWHNEVFWLTNREEPVELLAIDAPNQVETVQGDIFVWLDNQFTSLTIHSNADREALLNFPECWPGPSRPDDTKRTLIVEINGEKAEFAVSPNLKVPLKLNQGDNFVRLSCKEAPTVNKLPSGDARTLLLGIKRFNVSAAN